MASIKERDLGDIQSERQSKRSQLFVQPNPGVDSNFTILLDVFGVTRNITVTGIITGEDSVHADFINSIEALSNGRQPGFSFVSSKPGIDSKNVFIDSFEWSVQKSDVNKIDYTLTLIEGDEITA